MQTSSSSKRTYEKNLNWVYSLAYTCGNSYEVTP